MVHCSQLLRSQSCLFLLWAVAAPNSSAADRLVTVPALSVAADHVTGSVQYIVLQLDREAATAGPLVQFNEIHLSGGSAVGPDWKEGVRRAVRAAARAVGVDGADWLVTVKNHSYSALTDGGSASSAVAVGLVALWRGERVAPGVVVTGLVTEDGRIEPVGSVPAKVKAAALAGFSMVLVPNGQADALDQDGVAQGPGRRVTVVEVGTLEDAYRVMTGAR